MSLLNNDSDKVNNSASVTGPSDIFGVFWGNDGLRVVVVVDVVGMIWVKVLTGLIVGICGLTFHALGAFGCCAAGGWLLLDDGRAGNSSRDGGWFWGRPGDGRAGNSSLEGGCCGRLVVDVDWVGWFTLFVVVELLLWVVEVDEVGLCVVEVVELDLWVVVVVVEEVDLWVVVEVVGANVVVLSSFPLKNPANPLKKPFFLVVVSGAIVVVVVGGISPAPKSESE